MERCRYITCLNEDIFIHNKYLFVSKMPTEWCDSISKWRNGIIDAPWLSNYDIDDIIIKYEKKYPTFKFLGSTPIDFRKKKTWNMYFRFI